MNDLNEAIDSYKQFAMEEMLEKTSVQLNAEDYTYMDMAGDENSNVAIKAVFDSKLEETPIENGLNIQASSMSRDMLTIPRFPMNTVVLRLYRAGTKTYQQAQDSINFCDNALEKLLDKRGLYGAYMNRLEYTNSIKAIEEENVQAAESRIRDTDMAEEMLNLSKHNILLQSGQSMLAQSNHSMDGILNLLQ